MSIKSLYFLLLSLILLLSACRIDENNFPIKNENQIKLAITKAHGSTGYEQYKKWILHSDSTIEIYDLYDLSLDSAKKIVDIVDGLIISGGPDVNPGRYNEDSLAYICEVPDNYRDSLEFQSIGIAFNKKIPILGICRGQQILNIYFGGSLIADIPTKHGTQVSHRSKDGAEHIIIMQTNNALMGSNINDTIMVNSYHHQAINRLAKAFIINAQSEDGIVESISTDYPTFFLGVQFHPEHMIDTKVSQTIANSFILSLKQQSLKNK
ncbi:MAG: gamma-glutamyl-gamma-aminobutyrate hydrolase family protein [Bacteroidales bacterium]|nr:gamma-glutamyl-gamma-aminobutyrate hydrolase family protein [Bacteroidales bacterium]